MIDAPVIDRLERAGWSWSVGRCRAGQRCDAYVHVPEDDEPGAPSTCFHAEGCTPELALMNAEAKAVIAGLPPLTPDAEKAISASVGQLEAA